MNPFRSDNPLKIYEYRAVSGDGWEGIFDTWEEAYQLAGPGDTIETWCKCSSYVIPEEFDG